MGFCWWFLEIVKSFSQPFVFVRLFDIDSDFFNSYIFWLLDIHGIDSFRDDHGLNLALICDIWLCHTRVFFFMITRLNPWPCVHLSVVSIASPLLTLSEHCSFLIESGFTYYVSGHSLYNLSWITILLWWAWVVCTCLCTHESHWVSLVLSGFINLSCICTFWFWFLDGAPCLVLVVSALVSCAVALLLPGLS